MTGAREKREPRQWFPFRLTLLFLVLSSGSPLAAQDPTRLPAVVVNAAPDLPGPRKLVGLVRDTSAIPIDSAEVSIPSLQRRAFTKLDGTFLFADIRPGKYEVRARKIGYAPQIREMVVADSGGTGLFSLLPLPHVLRPVVTTVGRGGISGVVGDTAFNALLGAKIDVLGHNDYTITDSLGAFYMPVQPGSYTLRVQAEGFTDRLVGVIVPPDSGQRVRITLAPPSRPLSIREVHNVDDFGERLRWSRHDSVRVYTRADMQAMKLQWVFDAVVIGYHEMYHGRNAVIDRDCVAMVNGGPDITEIGKLTVDDIEAVEVYPMGQPPAINTRRPASSAPGQPVIRRGSGMEHVPLSNTERAIWANRTKTCTLVYVWLR